jgi:hypothetical protein
MLSRGGVIRAGRPCGRGGIRGVVGDGGGTWRRILGGSVGHPATLRARGGRA